MDKDIIDGIKNFREDRNWSQFHNPKDLAISISLEASELLENFQWSGKDLHAEKKRQQIKEELADVLIYSIMMSDTMDFDLAEIISEKLKINNQKYPVEKAFGKKDKYTEL
ncbi:nucleotide pyrophosphohydrolase [Carnobacterium alterfunditum]|uniref:nucleotide pyrophosphohydrolase n=1 Tax=Carnobacterium alterfunditum TaxID=28230 RepID=UPI003594587B